MDMATLYSVVVTEVGFLGLSCKKKYTETWWGGSNVGILYDTECFFDLGGSTTDQWVSSVFVKKWCLPYGVLSLVKKGFVYCS